MRVRGRRECTACQNRWSYYETGSIECPACGSLRSVGVDDRSLHTASSESLRLAPVREAVDEQPIQRLAERAADRCLEFTRGYGFVDAGELVKLDDTYLAAMELRSVATELARRMNIDDGEERYFYALLNADEGSRPPPEAVPDSLRGARGLAYADAVSEYRSDLRTYLDEHPDRTGEDTGSSGGRSVLDGVLERLTDHVRRVRALDGDVEPSEAETLVAAARDVGRYLVEDDEAALAEAAHRLDRLV